MKSRQTATQLLAGIFYFIENQFINLSLLAYFEEVIHNNIERFSPEPKTIHFIHTAKHITKPFLRQRESKHFQCIFSFLSLIHI